MQGYSRNIIWKSQTQKSKILQIYRKGLEYALVSDNYEQCNEFVLCKDFLQDIIFATIHNKKIQIYNFEFDPKIDFKPSLKKIRLLVTNSSDKKFRKKIFNSLNLVNKVEKQLDIPNSIVRNCNNPPEQYKDCGVFLFEGHKRWLNSPPMLSFYTLLIRIGFNHKPENSYKQTIEDTLLGNLKPYQKKDVIWLKQAQLGIEKIEKLGDKSIFFRNIKSNYPDFPINDIHNCLGITGFSCDIQEKLKGNKVTVPGWHKE